jgi:hypothetical protein
MAQESSAAPQKKPNLLFRLLALLVTAALILGALVLVVYRDRYNLDALKRWLSYRNLETSDTGEAAAFVHAGGSKPSFAYLDSGVVLSSASGVHYYSFTGESYAEQVMVLDNPVLSAAAKAAVAYDAGGQSLFLFRDGSQTMNLTLEGNADLLSARVNDSGWLTVTAQQSGYKGAVTVYNASGSAVIQISLSSTFVVDAALSPDCKTVAVVTMDQSGGVFSSKALFYPINQKEPTQEVDLGGMTVLDLDYESGQLWLLGDDQVSIVDDKTGDSHTYSFGRSYLKGCDLGGDGFALVLTGRYRAGSATQALVIGPDGTVQATLDLNGQVLDCSSAGNYCSILTGSRLTIYNQHLESYATLESTQGALYTDLQSDGSALLADSQQAWLFIPG